MWHYKVAERMKDRKEREREREGMLVEDQLMTGILTIISFNKLLWSRIDVSIGYVNKLKQNIFKYFNKSGGS